MPFKPKRPCGEVGCNTLTSSTHCDEHTKQHNRESDKYRSNASGRGYDYKWRRYRVSFLRRSPLCKYCSDSGHTVPATDVDHITPHRGDYKLFWDASNHQGLCKACHSTKTANGK